jgi:hypothetical protein
MQQAVLDERRHHLANRTPVDQHHLVDVDGGPKLAPNRVVRRTPLAQLLGDDLVHRYPPALRSRRAAISQQAIDHSRQALHLLKGCSRLRDDGRVMGRLSELLES